MLSPFMVAAEPVLPDVQPQAPAAVYNWENQGEMNILNEEDMKSAATGTFSSPGGGAPRVVDDWHLC